MELLKKYFHLQGFSDAEATQIALAFIEKQLHKGDYFIEEGKTSRHFGFIEKGFLQYYVIINGEEKTTYSVSANNFVASLVSFLKEVPARENIRAVMDTVVWIIEKKKLQHLLQALPSFKAFYIEMLEYQICCIDESRLDGIMLSAHERYVKMLAKEPELIQQIPLQYLASILGITPRHLSRIRNNIR